MGGWWHEKVVSVFSVGHPKSHFLVPKIGQFCKKWLFSGAKKWDFGCPKLKTETTFSCQHPPKMVEWTFVLYVYHFLVGFQPNLKNCIFCTVLEPFSQQHGQKNKSAGRGGQTHQNVQKIFFSCFSYETTIETTW